MLLFKKFFKVGSLIYSYLWEKKVNVLSDYKDYCVPMVDKCNLGKYYHYRGARVENSLPCPCCSFLGFSKLFDKYYKITKFSLLTQGDKGSKLVR